MLPFRLRPHARRVLLVLSALLVAPGARLAAQPSVVDPSLAVRTVTAGLTTPISLAFLGPGDFLVLEKNTGQVKRVVNGVVQGVALDLAVNFASERGLLGLTLHPGFPSTPFVYLYWTQSSTGADTNVLSEVPLLGNRVDRFAWNGTTLTLERSLLTLRARQTDNVAVPGHPGTNNPNENGNHNGGSLAFGPDGMLYVFTGDRGRRGWMQNLPNGPFTTAPFVDDTFGGPQPDNAHLTGVVLRLRDDGSTPADNPFFGAGAVLGGEVGANVQKVFSYGHRNSIGMAFDPLSGGLWLEENGDDSFTELNRVFAGMNGGWVQIAGPAARIAEFKGIETTFGNQSLQQLRWAPTNIADSPAQALARLFVLPGSQYSDPEFSWKWEVAPAGLTFQRGAALGAQYAGDLFLGAALPVLEGGFLFRFNLTPDRTGVDVSADPRLADLVADNAAKNTITESESLLFGRGFGVVPDLETGPNGNLFVVSLSQGAVYEIAAAPVACFDPLTEPSFDGLLLSDGARRLIELRAPQGAARAEFYNGSPNLFVGAPESAGGAPLAHTRAGNTFTFTGSLPVVVRFALSSNDPGTTRVSFFVRITDTCGRTVDIDPALAVTSSEAEDATAFGLDAPSPNPAAGRSQMDFGLNQAGDADLAVYDVLGRRVVHVRMESLGAGRHTAEFDASTLPAGTYVVRLTAGSQAATRLLSVVR